MESSMEMQAILIGGLAVLPIVGTGLVRAFTEADQPNERRAKRIAALLTSMAIISLISIEWLIYAQIDAMAAAYGLIPCFVMVVWIAFSISAALYRKFGGVRTMSINTAAPMVESPTLEQQERIWERLRVLPYFRETLDGKLISLFSGDRVYWDSEGESACIVIQLSSCVSISACRFETLRKYIAVQTQIGQWFEPTLEAEVPS